MLGHLFPVNEKFTYCYNHDEYQYSCFSDGFQYSMKRLEPRQVLVLAALGRNDSIHSAARDLSLTQSAVSKALAEIEAQMGAVLFTRSRQGIEANALGRLVLRRVTHLLHVLDHGPGHHPKEGPVLNIGYVSDLHGMALGQAFVQWRQSQVLTLRLLELEPQLALQLLRQAELDAVLLDEPTTEWPEQHIVNGRMVPVLRTQHPCLREGRPLNAQDLQALDWVLPTAVPAFHRNLEHWMAQAGIGAGIKAWKIPAGQGLSTMAAQSDALAWLPAVQADYLQQAGVVEPLCLQDAGGIDAPASLLFGDHVQSDPVLHQALEQFAYFLDHRDAGFGEQ